MIHCMRKDGTRIKDADSMTMIRSAGKYDPGKDPFRDYLAGEFSPAVAKELDRARQRWGAIPIKPDHLDKILEHQNNSEAKAIRFIKYKFLGECSYTEVYGRQAEREYTADQTKKEIAEIHSKIDMILALLGKEAQQPDNVIQLKRA